LKDNIPLIVGTGNINTDKSIYDSKIAEECGADSCLIVTPPYLKVPHEGLITHFNKIADRVNIPIILYDVKARTGYSMEDRTIKELSYNENIIGIKECCNDINRLKKLKENCHKSFLFFSGEDDTCYEYCKNGADGVISVTGNIYPKLFRLMMHNIDSNIGEEINNILENIYTDMFCYTNPIPIKYAVYNKMYKLGKWNRDDLEDYLIREPLVKLPEEYQMVINQKMIKIDNYLIN
jgi:4-hydroxy-tetrahydrodipicolinate synthase